VSEVADAAGFYASIVEGIGSTNGKDETGFQSAFSRCESPIEQAFCLAMFQVPNVRCVPGEFSYGRLSSLFGATPTITVFPQQPILQYRADFLLVGTSPICAEPIFSIIECDGADYHSAPHQITRDERRERALRSEGFKIIRFTGRELFGDPQLVGRRTLAAFTKHGWSPPDVSRWIDNYTLRRALAQLQQCGPWS
jgi:very-short-patch-repair endonuclease